MYAIGRYFFSISLFLTIVYAALPPNTTKFENHHIEDFHWSYQNEANTVWKQDFAVPDILWVNGDVTWN